MSDDFVETETSLGVFDIDDLFVHLQDRIADDLIDDWEAFDLFLISLGYQVKKKGGSRKYSPAIGLHDFSVMCDFFASNQLCK